jgi:hypothetical protein
MDFDFLIALSRIQQTGRSMLHEFSENCLHNLFKPLLLFFYFGFLIPILKVDFESPRLRF